MSRLWGIPLLKRLSTKMVIGFIAIMAVFSVLGLLASREVNRVREAASEAVSRSEAVQHLQDARVAADDQILDHYELLLENRESAIGSFEQARQRRDQARDAAAQDDPTSRETDLMNRLRTADAQFDDNFLNGVVPAWRAGDLAGAVSREKVSDNILGTVRGLTASLISDYQTRNQDARSAADLAATDARTYLIYAALTGFGLSLLIALGAARRLSRPLSRLKDASVAMTHGDLDRRVPVTTNDEIAELATSFNRMADSVQHKIRQLTRLSDIALAISSEYEWENVVGLVMEKGMEITDSQAAAIVLYDDENGQFTDTYTKGLGDKFVGKMQFRRGGLADEVLLGDTAVFSDDIKARHRLSKLARDEGIRAFICLPLKVRRKKLGVFYVYSKEAESYGHEELAVLSILSNQAAIAIQNAQRYERSQEEAITDGLTGLYNQRYFYKRLHEEIKRAERNQAPLSVIFTDLDKFKVFNDLNGHGLGDRALKDVSRIISDSKRAVDMAARYGGEEFAIILPETDTSGAQIIAHRIRRRVAAFNFATKEHVTTPLTTSIGVASFPEDAQLGHDLVDKADWSMYYGKRQGGNRVTLFHEESGEFGALSLEDLVREELHLAAAQAMAASVDERNSYDKRHAESVARMASSIAHQMGLDEDDIHEVRVAGLLHDIGLVSVPEEIINKRGRLSADEWNRIKGHPEVGETILKHIASLQSFLPIVRHHHEHYDGGGYPDGLITEKIPLGARIIAVADAFQAMTSDRPYRRALTTEQALYELEMASGTQFDPGVVQAFVTLLKPSRQAKAS